MLESIQDDGQTMFLKIMNGSKIETENPFFIKFKEEIKLIHKKFIIIIIIIIVIIIDNFHNSLILHQKVAHWCICRRGAWALRGGIYTSDRHIHQ